MKQLRHFLLRLALSCLVTAGLARAQFVISEFMAENNAVLNDEDGANSDWVEIHNESNASASLGGWYLTDTATALTKWQFPPVVLPADGYLIVFASNKNRRTPGAPLHTNFKLSAAGEYLGLVKPDGTTVTSEFAPTFSPQVTDISYGIYHEAATVTILPTGTPARAFVPPDDSLALTWTGAGFAEPASWLSGNTGIGYDRQTVGVNYLPLIGLNVESVMYPTHPTIYVRVPFTVTDPAAFSGLILRLKYDDGFIAYLNGQEIARDNVPVNATWNSPATAPRTDTSAIVARDFDVSAFRGSLILGTNVLSFHVMNNPANSPDLLLVPQLDALTPNGSASLRYFPVPTPGQANNAGVPTLGPIITEAQVSPDPPSDADNLTVTARLIPAFGAVSSATLHYVVMFGSEVSVPFLDNGLNGDGSAGDGIFGARIPAAASAPGQMVRWYISATDNASRTSRLPAYLSPTDSPQYFGTVITNPALTNPLPVFHWFVANVAAADTTSGTRGSVYWNGQFYDNVFCRVRGATAPLFSKKPYKFDFNPGDHFRFQPGETRVDELNLNTTYQDKAYLRAPLTFEGYRAVGVPASDCFNVRVQQNNTFLSVAVFTEQVDTTFLERRGLDPDGALYKMFNGLTSSTAGVEKKTRRTEANTDLQSLVAGLVLSNPNRAAFVFDNFDLPALINYLAVGVLQQDLDRTVKNYYLYCDTNGTGLWRVFPWDKDLTFGLFGLEDDSTLSGSDDTAPYTGKSGGYISYPLFGMEGKTYPGGGNNLFDAIFGTTATRDMFLRRLRTLMDQYLQPPGTPVAQLSFENRINELIPLLQPDATLDLAKWQGGFGQPRTLSTAIDALKTEYLADRRIHLYQTHSVANAGAYPDSTRIPTAQTSSPALTFGTVEFSPSSGDQSQEYIELLNPTVVAADISGWTLDGAVQWTFTPGTVIPAGGKVYVSPNVVSFRNRTTGPRGGQSLLVVGNYPGQLTARGGSLTLRDAAGGFIAATTYAGSASAGVQFLRITELMYHPSPLAGSPLDKDEFEFVELKNTSSVVTLSLAGVRLVGGVQFNFTGSAVTSLPPGATALVVKNIAAFTARYGAGWPVAGTYAGALGNDGDSIQLLDAAGEIAQAITFADYWYPITDGLGFSLVAVDEFANPEAWSTAAQWRPSSALQGSPGAANPAPVSIPHVVINEVLSRADTPPSLDSIELVNPGATPAVVGGWFLTNDFNAPAKYQIPAGTVIPAGGFRVFTEADFNPAGTGFSFGSDGAAAWLFSANAQGQLTGYVHGFSFGAAADGVSFGRYVDSLGVEHFPAQTTTTLGLANSWPRIGPVVISEIHYHPSIAQAAAVTTISALDILRGRQAEAIADAAKRLEFVEIQNITDSPVPLFDPLNPANTWRLRGDADFDFPPGLTLSAGATLLVVNFDPAADSAALIAFRTAFGVSPSVTIIGPFSGSLNNAGARLELQRPDAPVAGNVPHIVVDSVQYSPAAPWPSAADGTGASLQRRVVSSWGDDPINWFAANPTPGTGVPYVPAPTVVGCTYAGNNFVLNFTTVIGFSYRVQSSQDLTTWQTQGTAISGNGSVRTATIPIVSDRGFFRVMRIP